MTRFLAIFGLMAMLAGVASAASIPAEWRGSDYPATATSWYGVEVAQFPSAMLAKGIEDGLEEAGWGPVLRRTEGDGPTSVIIGEVDNAGQAWFLAEELKRQKIAEGKIVRLDPEGEPRGFIGPASKPFTAGFAMDAGARGQVPQNVREALDSLAMESDSETSAKIMIMQDLLDGGKVDDPKVAQGAVVAAQTLWEERVAPESALFLASRVASGVWPLTLEDAVMRREAQDLTYRLLHGYKRDWAGAWQAARELERTAENDRASRAANMLRKAALMVDLVEKGADPRPTFPEIRQQLRRAYEEAPEDARQLRAQIEIVYLQTFAWEGNWERVEPVAQALVARYDDQPVYQAMARILEAQSLERVREYDKALDILNSVSKMDIPRDDYLRWGMETLNPADVAQEKIGHFEELAVADSTTVAPAVSAEPKATPAPKKGSAEEPVAAEETSEEKPKEAGMWMAEDDPAPEGAEDEE